MFCLVSERKFGHDHSCRKKSNTKTGEFVEAEVNSCELCLPIHSPVSVTGIAESLSSVLFVASYFVVCNLHCSFSTVSRSFMFIICFVGNFITILNKKIIGQIYCSSTRRFLSIGLHWLFSCKFCFLAHQPHSDSMFAHRTRMYRLISGSGAHY